MPGPVNHESTVQAYLHRASYRNVESTKRDVILALKHYRGLQPKLDKFIFNDGRGRDLLSLEGTIPVPFKGSNYNIPVAIWLLDTHPSHAPLCYVRPTPDMQIKISQNVDCNGKIYLPYLHEWNSTSSDILSLIQMCIITFSEEPPVFAKPAQQQPMPPPRQPYPAMPYPAEQSRLPYPPYPPQGQQQPYPPAYNPTPAPAVTAGVYSTPYPAPAATGGPLNGGSGTISQELIGASLQTAVEDKIRRALADDYATKQAEIQNLEKMEEELGVGKRQLESTLGRLDSENMELEGLCSALEQEKVNLETALTKFQSSDTFSEDAVDDKIVTVAPLYKQIVSCYAEELAISDAIYFLSQGLRKGQLDLDTYLKQVRGLSRKQFFLRATMEKAREKAGLTT